MRKVLTFLFIFTGTVFSVFIIGLALYTLSPDLHDAISAAVSSTDDIPVVTPEMVKEKTEPTGALDTEEATKISGTDASINSDAVTVEDEEVALSGSASTENKPVIVDKEYHEDCGTGEGYWVITYSDGSTAIE